VRKISSDISKKINEYSAVKSLKIVMENGMAKRRKISMKSEKSENSSEKAS